MKPEHQAIIDRQRSKRHASSQGQRRQKTTICPHLGERKKDREGIPMKVSCGCTGKEREIKMGIHECDLHRRCLPNIRLNDARLESWSEREESKLYQLCQICVDRPASPVGAHHPKRLESAT